MFYSSFKRLVFILFISMAVVFAASDIVPLENGYLYTDSLYSSLYVNNDTERETIISAPGVGRFYTLSPDDKYVGIKYRETPGGLETPALIDLKTYDMIALHEAVDLAGQVSFSNNNSIAYTIGNTLVVKQGELLKHYDLGNYVNLAPISPDAKYVVYNDDEDQLWILNLQSEKKEKITENAYGHAYPQWANDSKHLSYQSLDGHLYIYSLADKKTQDLGLGAGLRWSTQGVYAYTKVHLTEQEDLESTQVISANLDGDILYSSNKNTNEKCEYFDRNAQLIVSQNGKLHSVSEKTSLFKRTTDMEEFKTDPIVYSPMLTSADTFLNVPYVNQVYDTPGSRGYSSCAPTTAAMVLGYYKLLPKWPFVSGFGNVSNYGAYVHERYYYHDYYFDQTYKDCNSSNSYCYTCYGGMGYMWSGGSPNSKMAGYYNKHGLSSNQTWSTNWTTVRNEIDKKQPFSICNYLSGSGHLVAAIGRVSSGQRTVIVNDPYGDRNRSSWPNYYGAAVRYDWPGYNHGHASLNYANSGYTSMPWCIATSYTQPEYPDSIIDDKQFDNGFYIKAEGNTVPMRYYHSTKTGYGGHHWWTYSEENESDKCYVTWSPNVDSASYYEIFAYIPAAATASSAKYRIHHAAGQLNVLVDQSAYSDEWVSLGKFMFRNDGSDYVYLGDSTGVGSQKLAFDAMRWEAVEVQSLDFTSNYTKGYPGFEVKFWVNSPISEGAYNYTWDFADGESETGDTVIHTFVDTGYFDISLRAETGGIIAEHQKQAYMQISGNEGNIELLSPELKEVITTSTPVLTWVAPLTKQTSPGYQGIYLSLTPGFEDTLYSCITTERYCVVEEDLPENKNIYWQVKSPVSLDQSLSEKSNVSSAIYSTSKVSVFSINAQNSLPLDFSLISPENNTICDSLKPTLSWAASLDKDPGDSLSYSVYLGRSVDSMECVYVGKDLTYTVENDLSENGQYFWYVQAVDMDLAVKRSKELNVFYINTFNEAPSAPRQLAPNHNSYQTTRYPYFEWTEVQDPDPGDEVTYKLSYWYSGSIITYVLNTSGTSSNKRRLGDKREYFWSVAAIDSEGLTSYSDTLTVYIDSEMDIVEIPENFSLNGNYPNPFNPLTRISYSIPTAEKVNISLFDLSGKLISTLYDDVQNPGVHTINLDASHLSSGIYIYKMIAGDFMASSKMLLLK